MDIVEAVRARRSVRGYKPDPVPREVLEEIIKTASRAPSTMNTQPWEITVVGGQAMENIKRGNIEMLRDRTAHSERVPLPAFEGKYRQRQVALAIEIFRLMGIAREDKEKRAWWMERGFRFFDAPAGIYLSLDQSLENRELSLFDIGSIAQTICLVALNYGLTTCIEDQAAMYPEVVRKFTGIPESKHILVAIAIGYPDRDYPVNRLESSREPIESFTAWCGF